MLPLHERNLQLLLCLNGAITVSSQPGPLFHSHMLRCSMKQLIVAGTVHLLQQVQPKSNLICGLQIFTRMQCCEYLTELWMPQTLAWSLPKYLLDVYYSDHLKWVTGLLHAPCSFTTSTQCLHVCGKATYDVTYAQEHPIT